MLVLLAHVLLATAPVPDASSHHSARLLETDSHAVRLRSPLLAAFDSAQAERNGYEEPVPNGFARIFLRSDDDDVRLYKQASRQDKNIPAPFNQILIEDQMVCRTPCGIVVDVRPGNDLYLGGPGMPSTPKFNLVGRSGDVVMDVHGGSYGELVLGYVGSWGGLFTGVSGIAVLVVGLLLHTSSNGFIAGAGNVLTVGGGVGVGLGLAFGLTGLYLVHDGQTRYELLPSGTRPPSDTPSTLSL